MSQIEIQAYETAQVKFEDQIFDVVPLTKGQFKKEEALDEKFKTLADDDLDALIAAMAERLNLRTKPVVDAKTKKQLGTLFKDAWEADKYDFRQLSKFAYDVLDVDPFGE